jgi:hypothetical protein
MQVILVNLAVKQVFENTIRRVREIEISWIIRIAVYKPTGLAAFNRNNNRI